MPHYVQPDMTIEYTYVQRNSYSNETIAKYICNSLEGMSWSQLYKISEILLCQFRFKEIAQQNAPSRHIWSIQEDYSVTLYKAQWHHKFCK